MYRSGCFYLAFTTLLLAADPAWKTKDADQWNAAEAKQIITNSPWTKKAVAKILPKRNENQVRDGGHMGGGQGVGLEALNPSILVGWNRPSGRFAANMQQRRTLSVCWESPAVRTAEKKLQLADSFDWDGDYYAIAVYAVPGLEDQKNLPVELRKGAYLRLDGKKDVLPSRIEVVPTDEKVATVLYLFPRSLEISKRDREIWFVAQIGQLFVEQSFDAAEMQVNGKLDL